MRFLFGAYGNNGILFGEGVYILHGQKDKRKKAVRRQAL